MDRGPNEDSDCTPHIPPKSNRYDGITYSKRLYKQRNLIERCFNKLKQFRHIATRYDRNALNYLAMIKIAIVRLWLRFLSPQPVLVVRTKNVDLVLESECKYSDRGDDSLSV